MKERFEGENRPRLIAALKRQEFSLGKDEIAETLAEKGELIEFDVGQHVISQNATDNDLYFLVSGVVGIVVNGAQIATRTAGQHVGEMAALEPSLPRSATVTALEKIVAVKISSAQFMNFGQTHPEIWLPFAQELARRLYQRNSTIALPNEAPKLFIISSTEARKIAHALRAGLESSPLSCRSSAFRIA